jgi:hypothetical protein
MTRLALVCTCAVSLACSSSEPTGSDASSDGPNQSDVGADGSAPPDGSSDVSSPDGSDAPNNCTLTSPPSNPGCGGCLQTNCCETANACLGSSDCLAYVACVNACAPSDGGTVNDSGMLPEASTADSGEGTGFQCDVACMKQYPSVVNDGTDFANCEYTTCAGKCP